MKLGVRFVPIDEKLRAGVRVPGVVRGILFVPKCVTFVYRFLLLLGKTAILEVRRERQR